MARKRKSVRLTPEGWDPRGSWVPMREASLTPESLSRLDRADPVGPDAVYVNHLYQALVYKEDAASPGPGSHVYSRMPDVIHLSIKRRDGRACADWRHLQQIKNEIVGREHDGMQLFPAESRLLDTANQYHLYVLSSNDMRWPVGGFTRQVRPAWDVPDGCEQRPFEKGLAPSEVFGHAVGSDQTHRGPGLKESSEPDTKPRPPRRAIEKSEATKREVIRDNGLRGEE